MDNAKSCSQTYLRKKESIRRPLYELQFIKNREEKLNYSLRKCFRIFEVTMHWAQDNKIAHEVFYFTSILSTYQLIMPSFWLRVHGTAIG